MKCRGNTVNVMLYLGNLDNLLGQCNSKGFTGCLWILHSTEHHEASFLCGEVYLLVPILLQIPCTSTVHVQYYTIYMTSH